MTASGSEARCPLHPGPALKADSVLTAQMQMVEVGPKNPGLRFIGSTGLNA